MHYQDLLIWASPLFGLDACLNRLHLLNRVVDDNVGQESPTLTLDFSYHRSRAKVIFRSTCMPATSVYR
jgi:hypothetical protein